MRLPTVWVPNSQTAFSLRSSVYSLTVRKNPAVVHGTSAHKSKTVIACFLSGIGKARLRWHGYSHHKTMHWLWTGKACGGFLLSQFSQWSSFEPVPEMSHCRQFRLVSPDSCGWPKANAQIIRAATFRSGGTGQDDLCNLSSGETTSGLWRHPNWRPDLPSSPLPRLHEQSGNALAAAA